MTSGLLWKQPLITSIRHEKSTSRMNCSRRREPPGLSLTLPVSSRDSATSYTPLDVQLTIPTKCTGFFVDLVLNFQVSLLPRWPSLRFHHLLTLSPEPRALNYSKNHLNQLRHAVTYCCCRFHYHRSQLAAVSRGINHTGGPILDSNLAPLDSSPVISTQPRTQLWPSTSPSTLPYILH